MVHISLPHRISGLHKNKSKEQEQTAGTATPENGSRRPSPTRYISNGSMLSGEKPLILKVYVIKVGKSQWAHMVGTKQCLGTRPGCQR